MLNVIKTKPFTVGLFNEDHSLCYIDEKLVIALTKSGPVLLLRNGVIPQKEISYALNLTKLQLRKGGGWCKRSDGLSFHLLEEREVSNGQSNARGTCSAK